MIEGVLLISVLVCLFLYPWPPLSRDQISQAGHLFWLMHTCALGCSIASFYLYLIEPVEHTYFVAITVIMLATALLRQTWRALFLVADEMATLSVICIVLLNVFAAIVMWIGSNRSWVEPCLLVPTILWDCHLFRGKGSSNTTGPMDGDDIEAQYRTAAIVTPKRPGSIKASGQTPTVKGSLKVPPALRLTGSKRN